MGWAEGEAGSIGGLQAGFVEAMPRIEDPGSDFEDHLRVLLPYSQDAFLQKTKDPRLHNLTQQIWNGLAIISSAGLG